ncbi:MAG TPA: adenylate/guanylate cyclase domain-containing protein, partial [Candidatus Cloacimonas sp.]|nr:adenylate/guanylate cyclase domain-containing protein [Candidatus Cloacimonas sp.]
QISEDIVIIAIDDESFSALNTTWPFPRDYHAKLIENLSEAGAKLIIFDIEFTENSRYPESDKLLANAAAASNNVVFAGKVLHGKAHGDPDQLLTPISDIVANGSPWGIVNMNSDSDNAIRKYSLFEEMDNHKYYSIGVAGLANSRLY